MKIKTSKLTGAALDWVVAKALGIRTYIGRYEHTLTGPCILDADLVDMQTDGEQELKYSRSWAQGGPIVEREGLWVRESAVVSPAVADVMTPDQKWFAYAKQYPDSCKNHCLYGSTFLVAAMRCFVASKLGDEVEVPAELWR